MRKFCSRSIGRTIAAAAATTTTTTLATSSTPLVVSSTRNFIQPTCPRFEEAAAAAAAPSSSSDEVPAAQQMTPGPYRRVGNVIFVQAIDHPFKFGWEANKALRDLRIEFKGQNAVHPDIPEVRLRIWRVRHAVKCEVVDLDTAKEMIGVPAHMNFEDLAKTIPVTFGRRGGNSNPLNRTKINFTGYRRMRMKDVMHRDAMELRLLAEKKKLKAARAAAQQAAKK